jgi:hypothetical protein
MASKYFNGAFLASDVIWIACYASSSSSWELTANTTLGSYAIGTYASQARADAVLSAFLEDQGLPWTAAGAISAFPSEGGGPAIVALNLENFPPVSTLSDSVPSGEGVLFNPDGPGTASYYPFDNFSDFVTGMLTFMGNYTFPAS